MEQTNAFNLRSQLPRLAVAATTLLLAKVLIAIVWEYRRYFPADFSANFLLGREDSFVGWYRITFYIHIIAGPLSLLLGSFLMFSGPRWRQHQLHRWAGRLQMLVLFAALLPSGLVMATEALAGPIAGWGFATLALATGVTAAAAVYYAVQRKLTLHRQWATRTYLLLISPLLFRIANGLLIVIQQDTDQAYRVNAWLSWLILLAAFEVWRYCHATASHPETNSLFPETFS
ncbi:DUF2306 domain-containing protein [Blastopirellula sp. J2-11]|uniref:DUF2306 domain-containing protein n=1 Tax=Blastopirellula sp. J2-11 TaxID=2943192 RepID=UPI0021C57E00|nr:DUF2306 domain-containing protein [Blastopirellula sp. J2-11]UUO06520.1 DUF2306 domain-containing protein [Blastopirellula sp. J2-11]